MSEERPRATEQLHVRLPQVEKQALREQARRYGISMSALVRIEMLAAQKRRERDHELQLIYPQKG